MVSFFWGELLFSSCPIVIDLNTCAHACCYCYANARRCSRRTNFAQVKKLADGAATGILGQVFEMGYPILMSNETDVLSPNNAREALAIVKLFSRRKTPMEILTKGGRTEDENALLALMADRGNCLLYVSITTADDERSKKVEPSAAPTSHRLDLIRRARALGIEVEVGFNPTYSPWMSGKENEQMQDRLMEMGVRMMFFNPLHISRWQVKDERLLRVMSGEEIARVAARKVDDSEFIEALLAARRKGAAPFEQAAPWGGQKYFEIRRRALGKAMPATGEFVSYAYEKWRAQSERNELCKDMDFHFSDYCDVLFTGREDLLTLDGRFAEFLVLRNFAAYVGHPGNQRMRNFKDLARVVWNDAKFKAFSPRRNALFAFAGLDANGDAVLRIDGKLHCKTRGGKEVKR